MDQTKKPKVAAVIYSYRGQDDSTGYLRLQGAGKELLVAGALYVTSKPGKTLPKGPKKVVRFALRTSPDFVRDREQDSTFSVRTETGERLRIIGKVVSTKSLPMLEIKKVRVISPRQEVPTTKAPSTSSLEKTPPQKKKPGAKTTEDEQFAKKLKLALILESSGEDDDVQMSFIHKFVNRSRSNVYLKLSKGKFPQPYKKVADGTYWKFSVIRAYKEGRWQPESPQP